MEFVSKGWIVVVCSVCLFSCSSAPELQDQAIKLQPDQGIAAISLDAPTRITQIKFVAKDKGNAGFEVPDTQGGPALYLLPVKAGRYCLQHFIYWRTIFNSTQDLGCFTVLPGKITYSGTIMPSILPDKAVNDQQFYPAAFLVDLKKRYPVLAGMYPVAGPAPVPAGVEAPSVTDELASWVQDSKDGRGQEIHLQNNTSWTLKLVDFTLEDCRNVKQACEARKMDMNLAPFATVMVQSVEPADPSRDYNYRFDYHWNDVD